jgi:hypothetical protein
MKHLIVASVIVFVSMMHSAVPAMGQSLADGQIQGVIRDSTGAAVPRAQIKSTQTDTQFVKTTIAGADGTYVLPDLPIGQYSLEVSVDGFKYQR